jgi:hypothetical protein
LTLLRTGRDTAEYAQLKAQRDGEYYEQWEMFVET